MLILKLCIMSWTYPTLAILQLLQVIEALALKGSKGSAFAAPDFANLSAMSLP